MTERKIMPERFSTLDTNMSLEKLILAKDNKEPIIGKAVLWNSQDKILEVDLGNGFTGILPIYEASIYPALYSDGKLRPSLLRIIGKNIIVTVKSLYKDNVKKPIIILSRQKAMLNAFDVISNSIGEIMECCITSFSNFGVFVDIGNGLTGLIHCKDLSIAHVREFSELGFDVGDKINAKVLSVNPNNFQIDLNYKDLFENMAFSLSHNDIIAVTILEQLNHDGYFGYLNPNTPVLIDVPHDFKCKYGDKIVARVKNPKKAHPERLNVEFISFE